MKCLFPTTAKAHFILDSRSSHVHIALIATTYQLHSLVLRARRHRYGMENMLQKFCSLMLSHFYLLGLRKRYRYIEAEHLMG